MSHCNLKSSLVLQLTPCMALYDTMLSLKSPIGTHCLGFAFNLAGFILAAGEKVNNLMLTSFSIPCIEYV
jgi:ATP-dependent protease ClpP protease subunit